MTASALDIFNAGVIASLSAHERRVQGDRNGANALDQEALDAFEQVLAAEPDHAGALGGKGMALAQLGRTQEAAECFQRGIELNPNVAENHRQLGLCYAEIGDLDRAREATRRAIDLEDTPEYREQAANDLSNFGDHALRAGRRHKAAGQSAEEERAYRHAHSLYWLALQVDGRNAHAEFGLDETERILCRYLSARRPWWRFW